MSPRIPRSYGAAVELLKKPETRQFLRYSAVSAISSVLGLVGLYVFYRVLKVGSAAFSNVLATLVATFPSYYLNRMWAWKRAGKSHLWREVAPFWVIAFISLALSTGAVALASHEAHVFHLHERTETVLVEFANFLTYAVLWVGKYFFFNRFLFANRAGTGGSPPSDGPGEGEGSGGRAPGLEALAT